MNPEECMNHQLNYSMSKYAYKFAKGKRFKDIKLYIFFDQVIIIHSMIYPSKAAKKPVTLDLEKEQFWQGKEIHHLLLKNIEFLHVLNSGKEKHLEQVGIRLFLGLLFQRLSKNKINQLPTNITFLQPLIRNMHRLRRDFQQI